MQIKSRSGLDIISKEPIDSRLILSKEEMKTIHEDRIMPSNYICVCKDDGKLYIFNDNNQVRPETGKFIIVDQDSKEYTDLKFAESEAYTDNKIHEEEVQRIDQDAQLNNKIEQEAEIRDSQVGSLNESLSQEIQQRQTGDENTLDEQNSYTAYRISQEHEENSRIFQELRDDIDGRVEKYTGPAKKQIIYGTTQEGQTRYYSLSKKGNMVDSDIAQRTTGGKLKSGQLPTEDDDVATKKYVDIKDEELQQKVNANTLDISCIYQKIPSQASYENQLADKAFVNSSVATNTANYISNNGEPFTSVEQLRAYTGTVANNDYAFVTGVESSNQYYDRYKATVSGGTVTWTKEYRLNNSSFTQVQWNAINSGITSNQVSQITTNKNDIVDLKADDERVALELNSLHTQVDGIENSKMSIDGSNQSEEVLFNSGSDQTLTVGATDNYGNVSINQKSAGSSTVDVLSSDYNSEVYINQSSGDQKIEITNGGEKSIDIVCPPDSDLDNPESYIEIDGKQVATEDYVDNKTVWEKGSGLNSIQSIQTEVNKNQASGEASVAEGASTDAHAFASHTEGYMTSTTNTADYAHAEGYKTTALGAASHAEGDNTVANNQAEHAEGKYNKSNMGGTPQSNTLHSVGIGNGSGQIPGGERKNAFEIMQNGDAYMVGIGAYDGKNPSDAETLQKVINKKIDSVPEFSLSREVDGLHYQQATFSGEQTEYDRDYKYTTVNNHEIEISDRNEYGDDGTKTDISANGLSITYQMSSDGVFDDGSLEISGGTIELSKKRQDGGHPELEIDEKIEITLKDYDGTGETQIKVNGQNLATEDYVNGKGFESASNKKAAVYGNEQSDIFYPTTKAVADYIESSKQFVEVTYGTSTAQDIKQILDAGKIPYLTYNNTYYIYSRTNNSNPSTGTYTFSSRSSTTSYNISINKSTNVWSNATQTLITAGTINSYIVNKEDHQYLHFQDNFGDPAFNDEPQRLVFCDSTDPVDKYDNHIYIVTE